MITKNYFLSSNHIMTIFLQIDGFKIQFVNEIIQTSIKILQIINKKFFIHNYNT